MCGRSSTRRTASDSASSSTWSTTTSARSGNYLRAYTPAYFSERYKNEWGDAINFDGPDAGPVREFFIANAGYWIDEFHMDGLRLDATQQIFDASPRHVIAEVAAQMREASAGAAGLCRRRERTAGDQLVRGEADAGMGLDGLWNDDFHHAAMVALTGRSEAYYCDTTGTPQEFIAAAKYGYLFQGQYYAGSGIRAARRLWTSIRLDSSSICRTTTRWRTR